MQVGGTNIFTSGWARRISSRFKTSRVRSVGISDFGSNRHWGITIWLHKAGLDPNRDVEFVRGIYHPVHIEALRSGKVDCAPVAVWEAEELKKEGCNALVTLQQQYPNGRPERIIAATGRILEERPELVKAFLRAMIRAYWFMRDMPKNFEYLHNLERRLRCASPDPEEREIKFAGESPQHLEAMPFPIDGLATGFDDLLREEKAIGDLNYDVPPIKDVAAQDLVKEAFAELRARPELQDEFARVSAAARRWGY